MAHSTAMHLTPSFSFVSSARPSDFVSVSLLSPKFNHFKFGQKRCDGSAYNFTKIRATVTLDAPETVKKKKKVSRDDVFNGRIDLSQVLRYPLLTEAAIKELANNNTLVFVVDVKANKKMIRSALKSLLDVQAKKINTSIRADGTKKAFIILKPEFNASDVARRIGIFSGGS